MRKAKISVAAFLFLGALGAVSAEMDPIFQVRVDSAVYSPDAFVGKGFAAQRIPASIPSPDMMPTRQVRDALFDRVQGLEAQIGYLDELDRDLLYMRASRRTLDDLKSKYPKVSESSLKALQELLKG